MVTNDRMTHEQPVYDILNETDTFPYYPPIPINGVAIVNDGETPVIVVINDGSKNISVKCSTAARNYDGWFEKVVSINVVSGSNFQIELRKGFD